MSRVSPSSAQTTSLDSRDKIPNVSTARGRFYMISIGSNCPIENLQLFLPYRRVWQFPRSNSWFIIGPIYLLFVGVSFWSVRNQTVFLFWMEENLTHQLWQLNKIIIHLALIDSWTTRFFFRIKRGIDSQINNINRGISRRLNDINLSCAATLDGWSILIGL